MGYSDHPTPNPRLPPVLPVTIARELHQCSLGTAACYLLVMLTAAILMTSSHSEGLRLGGRLGGRIHQRA